MLKKTIREVLSTTGGEEPLDKIYLFGSSVIKKPKNDIDILITYYNYSEESINKIIEIRAALKSKILKLLQLESDIILLSVKEELQLDYLSQIDSLLLYK